MNRIDIATANSRSTGRKLFIPFLPIGYPSMAATSELMAALEEAGADLIELGVPFSDSLADGPTIQFAYHEALRAGLRVGAALDAIQVERTRRGVPFVLMCCYNIIHRAGLGAFVQRAGRSGIDGFIVPDLPFDESTDLSSLLSSEGLCLVNLIAPTTPASRVRRIAKSSTGFVYYISRKGLTGVGDQMSPDVSGSVSLIQRHSSVPVIVGFGISKPEQAADVARTADGVIVGSALVEILRNGRLADPVSEVAKFAREIRAALDRVGARSS